MSTSEKTGTSCDALAPGLVSVSYYNARKVCLSLCLSALSSAFPVARSWTPTAAFESLGLRYVPPSCPHLPPRAAWGGGSWVAGSSFPADSAKPVILAHPVVLHGGKLPPIGRGTSSLYNMLWTLTFCCFVGCRRQFQLPYQWRRVVGGWGFHC